MRSCFLLLTQVSELTENVEMFIHMVVSIHKGSGTDPGFFLGRGAPLRNDMTDSEVKKF